MAAAAAVASVGTAEFLVLLVAERDAAVPSVAGGNVDIGFVYELHDGQNKAPQGGALSLQVKMILSWNYADGLLVERALGRERHVAVHQREQRVVLADAHIRARVEPGAALAHDDGAGADQFAAERLHAEHLGLGIPPVSRRAAAFFLCHFKDPLI